MKMEEKTKENMNLDELKKEYSKFKDKYSLPEFNELNKFFDIDFAEANTAVKNVDMDIKKGCKKDEIDFNSKMVSLKYAKKYSLNFIRFL